MSDRTDWLVWSHEHQAWWRPNARGYTYDPTKAGRYTEAEAKDIADNAEQGYETAVPALPVLEAFLCWATHKRERAVDREWDLRNAVARLTKAPTDALFATGDTP